MTDVKPFVLTVALKVVHGLAVSTFSGNLLEVQILRLFGRSSQAETVGKALGSEFQQASEAC